MSGSTSLNLGITNAQFRIDFPEFDVENYPDGQVNALISLATNMFDPLRWGPYYQRAIELFTAHSLSLAKRAAAAGANGIPGTATLTSSKSVGKVSVSYNYNLSSIADAGPYNLTVYGQELYFWMQIYGIGALQLTALNGPAILPDNFVGAWAGPLNNPGE